VNWRKSFPVKALWSGMMIALSLGDSLRRSIDGGLAKSRYGVVILSKKFFEKEWPQKELNGLVARENGRGKVILPIWHNVTKEQVTSFSHTSCVGNFPTLETKCNKLL